MEKGTPSTPAVGSTQGSCPVQDGASQPSPTQIPPSLVSDITSRPTKSSSSTDLQNPPSTSLRSSHASPGPSGSPSDGPPSPPTYPIFDTEFIEDSTLASARSPLESSEQSSPSQSPSLSRESAAQLSCKTTTDATCSSNSTRSSPATSVSPMKRSFASMAKLVMLQEKVRKAQKTDDQDEDEGEIPLIPFGWERV